MTTFDYMYDQNNDEYHSIEDYLLNASLLLGNNPQQAQLPLSYGITSGNTSSSNSCIDDVDYLNPSFSIDIFTPAATVHNATFSSAYPMQENDMMGYFFMPPFVPISSSIMSDETPIKLEFDSLGYFALEATSEQQPFFDKDSRNQCKLQQFPNSPESVFSVSSLCFSSDEDTALVRDLSAQSQPQPQPPSPSPSPKMDKTPRQKVFPCTHCNRSFARKYDAARHKRIHTGIKPYSCPCCNKGFARSDARVRHFRTEFNCRDGADKIQQRRHRNDNQRRTASVSSNLCHF